MGRIALPWNPPPSAGVKPTGGAVSPGQIFPRAALPFTAMDLSPELMKPTSRNSGPCPSLPPALPQGRGTIAPNAPSRHQRRSLRGRRIWASLVGLGLSWGDLAPGWAQGQPNAPALGESRPGAEAVVDEFCRFSSLAVAQKESLRLTTFDRDPTQQPKYADALVRHGEILRECRSRQWPRKQAIWLRVYPCDLRPGNLEQVFDRIVNLGYNQVYLEVFYDGRVLLPQADNPTVWPSVLTDPGQENVDMLAMALELGRQRGLEVYSWMFTMNFGYTYAQQADRQTAIARNAQGQSSLDLVTGEVQVFIDPYNSLAQRDYRLLVEAILKRNPDGVLFDYIRYPRGEGTASVVSRVQDLLIHSPAARQALINRAFNQKGRDLIDRFLRQGYVGVADVTNVNQRYPQEKEALWQGRSPRFPNGGTAPEQERPWLQQDLWLLSVAHAQRGVLDFLSLAALPAQRSGRPAGAVFFPGGDQTVGQGGFDSRLQPWPQFSPSLQWHPMAYANCQATDCIVKEVNRVLAAAPAGTWVQPALAGRWGSEIRDRPSLEAQMQALKAAVPQLPAVSHFAYSWQYPQDDHARKFCRR